jgi:hypothetical protein
VILAELSGQVTFLERTFNPEQDARAMKETREFNFKTSE